MFKRIIARLLIFLQIYSILFQGIAHANFTDNYPIRNQIHLQTSINKNGSLCLRLGTDGIDDPKELQWFDIPTDNLNSFDKKSQSKLAEGVQVEDDNLSQYSGSGLSTNDSGNGSVVNDSDLESPGISSKDQGTCFTLQGLKFTISTKGAILIKGRETYYEPKPLFLSGSGPITLDGVKASDLKITASKIAVSGFSKIDCLSIEGIGSEASFVNSGNLTAKQMFLNNLKGNNTGSITSDSLSLQKSTFVNSTKKSLIDIKTLVLGVNGKGFKKSTGRAVFRYSPKLLEEEVRKECQNTLSRGYFFDNEAIDLKAIKQLHKNASAYLEEHHLLGKDLNQALMVKDDKTGKGIDLRPSKPLIFYDAVMNVEGVEELVAKLYVPEVMMDDVRGKLGSNIKTKALAIFPKGVTIRQALETVRGKPIAQILENFFKSNPALMEKEEELADNLEEIDISKIDLKNSITMYGTIQADETAIYNAGDLNIHGYLKTKRAIIRSLFGNVILKSLVERTYVGGEGCFVETIPLQARIEALYDTLDILAKQNIIFVGGQTFSAKGTHLEALGSIYDVPVQLVSQSFQSHSDGWTRDRWVKNVLSSHKSGGDFNSYAGDKQHLCTNIDVGKNNINVLAKNNVTFNEAHDTHESQSHTKTESSNIFGGTKTINESSGSSRSVGSSFTGGFINFFTEQGDINLTNVRIDATKVNLSAVEGLVRLMLGTNSYFSSKQSSGANLFWQSQSMKQSQGKTYSQSTIEVREEFNIYSKGTNIEHTGQIPEYAKLIKQHGGKITYQVLQEVHKSIEESHQGPTAAFAALVSIAISIATAGTGMGLGELIAEGAGQVAVEATATTALSLTTAGTIMQGMTTAFFTTLCSQAALAVLNCDGNPENVLKTLASEENLKSLLSSTLKGGAGNPSGSFFEQIVQRGMNNTVGAGLDKLISNKPLDQGMIDAWINAGIDTVAQVCANKIGELYKPDVIKTNGLKTDVNYSLKTDGVYNTESINYATHKVLHGALGAGFGAGLAMISNTDPRLGAVSGAVGAIVSEMMAEGFAPEMADVEQYAKDHPGTDPESLRFHFMAQAQNTANWSAFAGAVGAFGLGLDVNTAHRTGKNAVDNNFIPGIFLAIMVATIFEYPQYLRDFETDKLHVALGKMGIEVAKDVMLGGIVFKVSGAVCKTFKEAAAAVVAQNPMLKGSITALESKFGKIEQYFVEKFNNQKILGGEGNKIYNVNNDVKVIKSYGPLNEGPLGQDIVNNFRSSSYDKILFENDTVLYRVISQDGKAAGKYWTDIKPTGSLQSIIDYALDPNWKNFATHIVTAKIPNGTIAFKGVVSQQRGLVGGNIQIYIPEVNESWILSKELLNVKK